MFQCALNIIMNTHLQNPFGIVKTVIVLYISILYLIEGNRIEGKDSINEIFMQKRSRKVIQNLASLRNLKRMNF